MISGSHSMRMRSSSGSGTVQLPAMSFAHMTAIISPRRLGTAGSAGSAKTVDQEVVPVSNDSTRFIPCTVDRNKSVRVKSNAIACVSSDPMESNDVADASCAEKCLVKAHSNKSMKLQKSLSNIPNTPDGEGGEGGEDNV